MFSCFYHKLPRSYSMNWNNTLLFLHFLAVKSHYVSHAEENFTLSLTEWTLAEPRDLKLHCWQISTFLRSFYSASSFCPRHFSKYCAPFNDTARLEGMIDPYHWSARLKRNTREQGETDCLWSDVFPTDVTETVIPLLLLPACAA